MTWALPVLLLPALVVLADRDSVTVPALVVGGSLAAGTLLLRLRGRADPRVWIGLSGGALLLCAAQVTVVLGGPAFLAWGFWRFAAVAAFLLALSCVPPLRVVRGDWSGLVADGLVGVGALVLLLVLAVSALPGATPSDPFFPALGWALLPLLPAVLVTGGFFRARREHLVPTTAVVTVLLAAVVADVAGGLAPDEPYAAAVWTFLLTGLAALAALAGLSAGVPWGARGEPGPGLTDWTGPRHLRVVQTVLLSAVVVIALLRVDESGELVVTALALGGLLAQVLLEGRQNRRLFAQVAEQARLTAAQAETDRLTGLLNRPALLDRIAARLVGGGGVQVVILDLDGFTAINEARGHVSGDALLREVADRLRSVAGEDDLVARFSADEFAVLIASPDPAAGHELAHGILPMLGGSSPGNADLVQVTASIGLVRARSATAATVVHHAELAMNRAKAAGGAQVSIFQTWMAEAAAGRRRTRALLSSAITKGDLRLALQPVVDARDGRWSSFEALVRWQDEDRLRPPMEFVPLAEESGLIVPMGRWILAEALRQIAAWPDPAAGIAVNVTARQLEEPDFDDEVRLRLQETGVDPSRLTLEIAEQTAVRDLGRTARRLAPLRELGVHVALDDFGTGFSSLAYLAKLPCDILKIDQKFVRGMGTVTEDEVLVRMMIRLGRELGLKVVAEGVETVEQADALRELGCDYFQGFLYSQPRPVAELLAAWALKERVPSTRTDTDSRIARHDPARIDSRPPVRGM